MKIAYLISAYSDPVQLSRLIGALYDETSFFYIHIDQKSDIACFENAISGEYKNVEFLKKRIFTQWGGWSQVEYQYELLKSATQSDTHYDRFFILSGMDYPLISNSNIRKELTENPKKEYLIGQNITPIEMPKIRDKLVIYHFFRDLKITNRTLLRVLRGSARLLMKALPIRKNPFIEVDGKIFNIFMSSSYMCITNSLAKFIVDQMEKNISLMRYFRYSFVPEELVIPTIVFNSTYSENAVLYPNNRYDGLISLAAIHHFVYVKSIKIYAEIDYDFLVNLNNKIFVRKVKTGVSDKLLEKIDAHRDA